MGAALLCWLIIAVAAHSSLASAPGERPRSSRTRWPGECSCFLAALAGLLLAALGLLPGNHRKTISGLPHCSFWAISIPWANVSTMSSPRPLLRHPCSSRGRRIPRRRRWHLPDLSGRALDLSSNAFGLAAPGVGRWLPTGEVEGLSGSVEANLITAPAVLKMLDVCI